MSKKIKNKKNKRPNRPTTPTFTHEFRLKINAYQRRKLKIKFRSLRELYNMVLGEIFKRENKLRLDPRYPVALSLYRNESTKAEGKSLFEVLNKEYFLKKY